MLVVPYDPVLSAVSHTNVRISCYVSSVKVVYIYIYSGSLKIHPIVHKIISVKPYYILDEST